MELDLRVRLVRKESQGPTVQMAQKVSQEQTVQRVSLVFKGRKERTGLSPGR